MAYKVFEGEAYLGRVVKAGVGVVYAYGWDDSPIGQFASLDAAIEGLSRRKAPAA